MPLYNYVAKNSRSETVKGKVEARDEVQAASVLRSRGLLVINVHPISEDSLGFINELLFGVKKDDVVTFTRQLSTMITAGLPLTQALSILTVQSKPAMAKMVSEIQREIEGGAPLSKALEKFPKAFSRVYVQLVKAGEVGGVIDEILNRLADNMEKDKEFRGKTKGALIYPAVLIVAMIVVAIVMMIFVVPQLTAMFDDFGAELPFTTQILIGTSNFFLNFWWVMLALAVAGFFGFRQWQKTEKGQLQFDHFLLKLPIIGVLRSKLILTEFARTMALLLSAGISLLQALETVSEASTSINYRKAFQEASQQVEKGIPLSQSLSKYQEFPPILPQMISVGEETGKLGDVLQKLSIYFQTESEQAVKNLTAAMEPMIMILLGIGVGFMVFAIIMPIYSLTAQF